ncbi:SPOR domain-containing protein [Pararhodobacter sp.]
MTTPVDGAGASVETAAAPSTPGQRVIERDVEAPEVFQVQDRGLWDGRPSLGGVWVAHPNARDPERVIIRNTASGQTVIGALFRRERENPGPRFQISSEAANALGILPGAPTEISVTALRLERVEMELDPEPEPVTAAAETLAIAPVETAAPAQAPDAGVAVAQAAPEPEPRRGFFSRFRRERAQDDAAAAIAETALAPVAAETAAETAAEAPRRRGGLFALFRRNDPEPDTTLIALPGAESAPAPAAPQPAPPQPQPQPQGPRIDRPYVQIGIFSVEQNARNARAQMQSAGLSAEIRRGRVGENLFWRVVVGPAGSTSERASILQRVRELGFGDAYAVVR